MATVPTELCLIQIQNTLVPAKQISQEKTAKQVRIVALTHTVETRIKEPTFLATAFFIYLYFSKFHLKLATPSCVQ